MAYLPVLEVIEATKNWVCPATGYYLITAVAGGGTTGGATSFGTYLTAAGAGPATAGYGGAGGYTLDGVYGGAGGYNTTSPTKNGGYINTKGSGYGAGGPSQPAGKLIAKIIHLTANEIVACTIGVQSDNSTNGVIVIKSV